MLSAVIGVEHIVSVARSRAVSQVVICRAMLATEGSSTIGGSRKLRSGARVPCALSPRYAAR
ncbi:MAG: hypothetical protein OHK0015_56270 [Chloroflexi bacterium OHK40]